MLAGFQKYLVDKGFTRWCDKHCGNKGEPQIENYDSVFLSTYSPLRYDFRKDNKHCWWGLSDCNTPTMYLGSYKINLIQLDWEDAEEQGLTWFKNRTEEEGYRILFQQITDYDLIYNVFMSDNLLFNVDCTKEKPVVTIINNALN